MVTTTNISNNTHKIQELSNKDVTYNIPLNKRVLPKEDKISEEKRLEKIQAITNKIDYYKKEILSYLWEIDIFNSEVSTLQIELNVLKRISPSEKIKCIQNQVKAQCESCLTIQKEKEQTTKEIVKLEWKVKKLESQVEVFTWQVVKLESINNKLIEAGLTDKLTKIWNREKFNNDIKNHIEEWVAFSIAFIDIDHFKDINDTYGHSTGDQVLKFLASKLKLIWSVYRRWWEEFIIIDKSNESILKDKLEKIKNWTLGKAYILPEHNDAKIYIKFSAWVIWHRPELNVTQITQYADDLMYQAKETRDTVVTFEETIKS